MTSATRSIDIDVPASALMEVICDFERYPAFVSNVMQIRVVERDEDRWCVEFRVRLFRRPVTYRLELCRVDPLRLEWHLVSGERMTVNSGSWQLTPLDEHRTRAVYGIDVTLEGNLPAAVASLLVDASLPRMLREFKRRAESLLAQTLEFNG